jgi:Fe-S-cluster containining protein
MRANEDAHYRGCAAGLAMNCRSGCGACCIAPSISSPTPKHPQGKPAGLPCGHLDAELRCELFGSPLRPKVCGSLQPTPEMCGGRREQALVWLAELEFSTRP